MKYSILIISMLIFGCESDANYLSEKSDRIAVFGLLNVDSKSTFYISEFSNISTDVESKHLCDYQIFLENGKSEVLEEVLFEKECYYKSYNTIEPSKEYSFSIINENIEISSNLVTVPKINPHLNVGHSIAMANSSVNHLGDSSFYYTINLIIKPPQMMDDLYYIVYAESSDNEMLLSISDPNVDGEYFYKLLGNNVIRDYHTEAHEINISMRTFHRHGRDTIVTKYMQFDEILNNYLLTKKLQQTTSNEPFSNPVASYSNIDGAPGIFASYAISSDTVIVEY